LSEIRVTYSGLIAFLVGIVGVITGLIFIILVTRRLSPEELGLWTLIGSLVVYVTVIEPIISHWTIRQIARGEKVAKTSLITSGLFSIIGMGVYSIIAVFVSVNLKVEFFPVMLAIFLVPLSFLNFTLNSILLSYKPQGISYGNITFEIVKLPLGFVLVYWIDLGLVGAILATIGSSIFKIVILFLIGRAEIIGNFKKEVIKFWFRLSWIPLYSRASSFIFTLDVLIFSSITGSLVGLAYWGVSNAISSVVTHSGQITQALYPKLLATEKKIIAEDNLKKFLYFAIPMVVGSIVFAKPALNILNPIYVDGFLIVYFLSIRVLVNLLSSRFFSILLAYEKIDLNENASIKEYIKSKLFLVPTIGIINFGSYIVVLTIFLLTIESSNFSEVDLVTIWSAILLIVSIPFLIFGIIYVKKLHGIELPYVSMMKFFMAATCAGIVSYIIQIDNLEFSKSIYDFLPQLIPIIIVGGIIYFGITYIIDKSTRELFQKIINEIKS